MRKHLWTIAFFFALIAGILLAGVLSAVSNFVTEPHATTLARATFHRLEFH